MKKIIFIALLLTSVSSIAANWVLFSISTDGLKYYYDATNLSGRTVGDNGRWTWVNVKLPKPEIINGKYYNETKEQWVYDCAGQSRVDDEIYYYNDSIVYKDTGIGKMKYIIPGSVSENLKDIVCR